MNTFSAFPMFSLLSKKYFVLIDNFFVFVICPESLHDKFAERSTISKYGTRNKTELQIPRLNLDFSRKSFNYTGLKT